MVNDYVNSAALRSREKKRGNSGFPKVTVLVGISFGLLCVLQSVLNISLRLQSERDQPFQDKERLLQENEEMKEKIRQMATKEQELQDQIKNLTDEVETLRNSTSFLEECESSAAPPSCLEGWTMFRSSCYQTSKTVSSWSDAKRDCEQKGAHLVIINDQEEEDVLSLFDGNIETLISLRVEEGLSIPSLGVWVDGTKSIYSFLNTGKRCVLLRTSRLLPNWMSEDCLSLHSWMCEMELSTSTAWPK